MFHICKEAASSFRLRTCILCFMWCIAKSQMLNSMLNKQRTVNVVFMFLLHLYIDIDIDLICIFIMLNIFMFICNRRDSNGGRGLRN